MSVHVSSLRVLFLLQYECVKLNELKLSTRVPERFDRSHSLLNIDYMLMT